MTIGYYPRHVFTRKGREDQCADVVEACVALGVPKLVNISSEQAPGFFSNNGPPGGAVVQPKYCPVVGAAP